MKKRMRAVVALCCVSALAIPWHRQLRSRIQPRPCASSCLSRLATIGHVEPALRNRTLTVNGVSNITCPRHTADEQRLSFQQITEYRAPSARRGRLVNRAEPDKPFALRSLHRYLLKRGFFSA
jgi:hypothetical protein